jgi:hypothetical protein
LAGKLARRTLVLMRETQRPRQQKTLELKTNRPPKGQVHAAGRQRILDLQRAAGNAAVGAWLESSAPTMSIQRYEAGEHAKLGAREGETEKTVRVTSREGTVVSMTYGEMISMGDLFESPEQMHTVTEKELTTILGLVRRERDQGIGSVSEKEWDDATGGRYLKLAAKNEAHFAPLPDAVGFNAGGEGNRNQWYIYHLRALGLAQRKQVDEAFAVNAFGDHFLTDAFSAGHLVNKGLIMMNAQNKANKGGLASFEKKVAKGVLATSKGAELYKYEANPGAFSSWAPMSDESLAAVIDRIRFWEGETFWSNFAKAVHDRLNKDIAVGGTGTKKGIEVTNKKGPPWRLPGDKHLSESPETIKIAREAVAQSQKNITDSIGKAAIDYPGLANAVWDYVPVPTEEGKKQIESVKAKLLDPNHDEAVDAWVAIITDPANFDLLVAKLNDKGLLKPVKNPAPAGR